MSYSHGRGVIYLYCHISLTAKKRGTKRIASRGRKAKLCPFYASNQAETPRAELRSLINCMVQLKRVNSLRSDNTRTITVCLTRSRWTAIPYFAFVISSLSKTLQPPLTRAHLHWLFAALSSEFFTLPFPDGEGWGLISHLLSIFVFKNLKDYRPNVVSNHCLRNNYKAESVWTKWVIPLFVEQIQMVNERSVNLRVSFWPLSLTDQRKRSKKNILQTKLHQIRFNNFLVNSDVSQSYFRTWMIENTL